MRTETKDGTAYTNIQKYDTTANENKKKHCPETEAFDRHYQQSIAPCVMGLLRGDSCGAMAESGCQILTLSHSLTAAKNAARENQNTPTVLEWRAGRSGRQ